MISSAVYTINFDRLIDHLKAPIFRKKVFKAVFTVFMAPIKVLHESFIELKDNSIYKVSHNGSVVLLQKVLNDIFDPEEKGIYIKNAVFLDPDFFYELPLEPSTYFYSEAEGAETYFYSIESLNANNADFTVFIPTGIQPGNADDLLIFLTRVKALLDYYKLFGTKYSIEWYD